MVEGDRKKEGKTSQPPLYPPVTLTCTNMKWYLIETGDIHLFAVGTSEVPHKILALDISSSLHSIRNIVLSHPMNTQ
jgi:hypothetical protein